MVNEDRSSNDSNDRKGATYHGTINCRCLVILFNHLPHPCGLYRRIYIMGSVQHTRFQHRCPILQVWAHSRYQHPRYPSHGLQCIFIFHIRNKDPYPHAVLPSEYSSKPALGARKGAAYQQGHDQESACCIPAQEAQAYWVSDRQWPISELRVCWRGLVRRSDGLCTRTHRRR